MSTQIEAPIACTQPTEEYFGKAVVPLTDGDRPLLDFLSVVRKDTKTGPSFTYTMLPASSKDKPSIKSLTGLKGQALKKVVAKARKVFRAQQAVLADASTAAGYGVRKIAVKANGGWSADWTAPMNVDTAADKELEQARAEAQKAREELAELKALMASLQKA